MSEDIFFKAKKTNESLEYNDNIFNEALIYLEEKCLSINNTKLHQLGLPSPKYQNNLLWSANQSKIEESDAYVKKHKQMLNQEQNLIFNKVVKYVNEGIGKIVFIDALGGGGKTFLINLLIADFRRQNKIVIPVASSGMLKFEMIIGNWIFKTLI